MIMKKAFSTIFLSTIFLAMLSSPAFALFEVSGDYGVKTQVYGTNRDSEIETTTVGASLALYLFKMTAIELNYNESETITDERYVISIDDSYDLTRQKNTVNIYSYGIGIRQAFASRKSRFRPSISLGYARQFTKDSTIAYFKNMSTGQEFSYTDAVEKYRYDSVFGSFHLELMLTRVFSIRASLKTIFKAFEFNRAQDNLQYMIGFSWYL